LQQLWNPAIAWCPINRRFKISTCAMADNIAENLFAR